MHISYDSDEESAANFEVSEGSLPFFFASFQFIRDNIHAIRNQLSTSLDLDPLEGDENFVPDFSYSALQSWKAIDCQVANEDMETGTCDQMIQDDSIPFCFESFHFLKGKLHSKYLNEKLVGSQQFLSFNVEDETDGEMLEQVVNEKYSPETTDVIILNTKPSLTPDLQPPNTIEGQIIDEGVAAEIHDLMMQEDSVPFCFEAFQFIKHNLHNISKEKHDQLVGCHIVSIDTTQQSSQVFDDPSARVLDYFCYKSSSPLANHMAEENVDNNLIQRSPSLSYLIDLSLQSSGQSLQSYEKIDKGYFCSVWNQQQSLVIHEIQDPFNNLLQSSEKDSADVRKSLISSYEDYLEQSNNVIMEINSDAYEDPFTIFLKSSSQFMLCKLISIQLDSKFPWELPFDSSLFLCIRKHLGRNQIPARMLTWLHWLFHFT